MKKTKKVLLGTAIGGTLIVGAGFGTYSWFTDSVNVSGDINNTTIDLTKVGNNSASNEFKYTFEDNFDKLAPGRFTISDWHSIRNDSGDSSSILEIDYEAILSADNTDASLDEYRNGAIVYIGGQIGTSTKNRMKNMLEDYLEEGDYPGFQTGMDILFDEGYIKFQVLDKEYFDAIQDGDDIVDNLLGFDLPEELLGLLVFIPREYTEQLAPGQVDVAKGTLVKVINQDDRKFVNLLYGASLSTNAGNEYQGAELDVKFNFTAHQLDTGENLFD